MRNDEAQIQLKKRIFESLDTGNLGERPYGSWIRTHLYTLSPEAQLLPKAFSMSHLLRQPCPVNALGLVHASGGFTERRRGALKDQQGILPRTYGSPILERDQNINF